MSEHTERVAWTDLLAVSLISASILLVELGITRLFSVITWNHLAFLAVSLALFGLSASGVFLHLLQERHPEKTVRRQMWRYALLFSALTAVMGLLFLRTPIGKSFTSGSLLGLIVAYLVAAAPFFAGGACLTLAVSRMHGQINRVYGADLTGAACGCLLFIPALNVFGGPGPLLLATGLGAVAATLFALREGGVRRNLAVAAAAAIAAALVAQTLHPFLDLRYTKAGEREAIFSKWNSYSRIAVYPEGHHDWGMSERYQGPHPETLFMDIDASASTPILLGGNLADMGFLRSDVTAFGYRVLPTGGHALVIGPGGGRDVWSALVFGAGRVTGVEINSIIVHDVMQDRFRDASGNIYNHPGVEVFMDDGRNFVARSHERYDLIQASLVDTWAATAAGAFALTENNLYTVEAFEQYIQHLKPDGVLALSRWSGDGLRVEALARAVFDRSGWRDFEAHFFVVEHKPKAAGPGSLSTFLVKRSPFSPDEIRRLTEAAENLGFRTVFVPPSSPDGRPSGDKAYVRLATTSNLGEFYDAIAWDVTPVVDDRPFFFETHKIGTVPSVLKSALFSRGTSGINVVVRLLCISVFLVIAFLIVPLFVRHRTGVQRRLPPGELGYFACLGIGFMLIEIGTMQRFVLFLGHPVYALTVILFTLLLGGGIGSAVSRRTLGEPRRVLVLVIPLIVLVGVLYAFGLPPLLSHWLGHGRAMRILASAALLLPLGVLLGMPMPAGIALVGRRDPSLLAWAWAVNGAASVLGSVLAIFIALLCGFRIVSLAGAGIYLVAATLGLWTLSPRPEGDRPAVSGEPSPPGS